uniref:NADH-ubiquinone oxidoreductase chain 2 n=2 Tax=Anterhynchium TaxID=329989 RepID=A0A6M9ATW2_9HYME|nr:NADH dehydrogenase subunit 2 [Anterhynchium aff. flavomarginatum HB]QKK69272.1 NADH dehydrogenase subunit 2 [Anterhynchium aff. flavomarginatum SC]
MNKSNNFFNYPLMFIFMIFMLMLNFLSTMTSNLIYLWMLLEINLMLFIFLMIKTSNNQSIIPLFFIIQSLSSLILIWIFNFNSNMLNQKLIEFFFLISICMKLGLFPFTWVPPIFMEQMNWNLIFMFSTLQKFIPFMMIKNFNTQYNEWIMWICLISIIFSTIKSLFTNKIKHLMAYSSINNSSWMIMLIIMNFFVFKIYFILYLMLMFSISTFFNKMNLKFLSDMLMTSENLNMFILLIIIIFSLSMIPPLSSFIIKLMASLTLIYNKLYFPTLILMICSTLSIIMYMSILIKLLFYRSIKFKNKFNFYKKNIKTNYYFIMFKIMFTTFCMSLYLIF